MEILSHSTPYEIAFCYGQLYYYLFVFLSGVV